MSLLIRKKNFKERLQVAHVAVILSGSGHQDGSEIHEAVLVLLELSIQGHTYQIFAPNQDQACTVNHLTHQKTQEKRNCLVEAARIARGDIHDLKELKEASFDALIFPGGFGAAMNLCNFAEKGPLCTVNTTISSIIQSFFKAKKPIGATCIAPVILAKALQGVKNISMTLGSCSQDQNTLKSMGVQAELVSADQCLIDSEHQIFTTPCYMEKASIAKIHTGIQKMIQAMFKR
jgi:enhancing lycopene biosynthesis protein 2